MSERQASTFRKGQFTDSHVKVLAYLNQLGVSYKAEEVVHCWGKFDRKDRPVSFKVDCLINDSQYGSGIIEVDGGSHKDFDKKEWRRDFWLKEFGFWIEHLPNKEVSLLAVSDILVRHRL